MVQSRRPQRFSRAGSESNSDVALALSPGPRHGTPPNPTQAEVGEGGCAAHPTARARGSHDTSTTTPCSAGLACLDRRRPGTGRPPARARVRRSPVVSTHARVATHKT
jgi:hypothetical protein